MTGNILLVFQFLALGIKSLWVISERFMRILLLKSGDLQLFKTLCSSTSKSSSIWLSVKINEKQ